MARAGKGGAGVIPRRSRGAIHPEYAFFCALALALLLSLGGLWGRLSAEWENRRTAIVVEYRDLASVARDAGISPEAVYSQLVSRGVLGVTAAEYTGRDLSMGALPLQYGPLFSVPESLRGKAESPLVNASLLIPASYPHAADAVGYLRLRMPGMTEYEAGGYTLAVLPFTPDELTDSGLLPDFTALDFARSERAAVLYRPTTALGLSGARAGASILFLKDKYPEISCVIPAGLIVPGYPEIKAFAEALKSAGLSAAQPEFVRQIGAGALFQAMMPDVIPLHSLVRDELIARRMTRAQVVERMVRAAHERSVRILLMRPYDMYGTSKLQPFLDDVSLVSSALRLRGYVTAMPSAMPVRGASLPGALAVSLVLTACCWFYVRRLGQNISKLVARRELGALAAAAAVLGVLIWKLGPLSRIAGGVTAAMIAAEAALWALDRYKKPFSGLVAGLLIVMTGGLVIAGHYGTTAAVLRLTPFSGVKLTLLLPPLLILASDLRRRVHPESPGEIMRRPPVWGELVLCAVVLGGALIMAVRSGNVSFVPGWEIRFRDMLERLLWVRPRTKEFLFGYPCLMIYYIFMRHNWAPRLREALRIGAGVAFSSAVNTFCHFHTLLPLTMMRVVNGWMLGALIGLAVTLLVDYAGIPMWRRLREEPRG